MLKGIKKKTVHEELAISLTNILRPANADQVIVTKFLNNSWFFFEILIKSMTQFLIDEERVKVSRFYEKYLVIKFFPCATQQSLKFAHVTEEVGILILITRANDILSSVFPRKLAKFSVFQDLLPQHFACTAQLTIEKVLFLGPCGLWQVESHLCRAILKSHKFCSYIST